MTKLAFLSIVLLVCSCPARAQIKDAYIPGVPPPPASMDQDHGKTAPGESKVQQHHIDLLKLQQEADDLARTAKPSLPIWRMSVKAHCQRTSLRNLSGSKLSKRLRSELNPSGVRPLCARWSHLESPIPQKTGLFEAGIS